jgi:hypothetical protein
MQHANFHFCVGQALVARARREFAGHAFSEALRDAFVLHIWLASRPCPQVFIAGGDGRLRPFSFPPADLGEWSEEGAKVHVTLNAVGVSHDFEQRKRELDANAARALALLACLKAQASANEHLVHHNALCGTTLRLPLSLLSALAPL